MIGFLNPWILSALAALPVLWWLLRIMPPPPKRIILPSARFLEGLVSDQRIPSKTPWWILLLRLTVAALAITAMAGPVYSPAPEPVSARPLLVVIDNSWAAAKNWDAQTKAADDAISRADRSGVPIHILSLAAPPALMGPFDSAGARGAVKGLSPRPWHNDYKAAAERLSEYSSSGEASILWLGTGISEEGFSGFATKLSSLGNLTYYESQARDLPLVLKRFESRTREMDAAIDAPPGIPASTQASVQAAGGNGNVLDQKTVSLDPGKLPAPVVFDMPENLRGKIASFHLAGGYGAGGVFLMDSRSRKHSVGIAGPEEESETKPFIEPSYYLKRALEPFTTLYQGSIEDILKHEPSVIILPDIGAMPAQTLEGLEKWVKDGGLLLRFAGPNMTQAQAENFLTPVKLRTGGRAMDGAMTWEKPVKIKTFTPDSPLYGLKTPDDVTVRRQILAEPSKDIEQKIWARLEDGTPLITAAPLEKGLLVMVHTTASADWSDLPLSGSFVEILRRIVDLSGSGAKQDFSANATLQPVFVLDGFGEMKSPGSSVKPIPADRFSQTLPSPENPPGIYGENGRELALNLSPHIGVLKAPDLPLGTAQEIYGAKAAEKDLKPILLYAALALLLIDWLAMLVIAIGLRPLSGLTLIALICISAIPAQAENAQDDMIYADGLYLAYIRSGDMAVDATARTGLENLGRILTDRTSAEISGVAALDPASDTLAFFPLIYWPVTPASPVLSAEALRNVQFYLDHGGTILFDTRDQNYAAGALRGTRNAEALRRITASLNIPPIQPIAKDHVLGKSFYLLDNFPGRYKGGTIWVESSSISGRDGVSSVIIGPNDWAGIWAENYSANPRQQEMAFRFGVNLMLYALTGNYKADQVHVPYILERLGQ